jgi:hypothetical protein
MKKIKVLTMLFLALLSTSLIVSSAQAQDDMDVDPHYALGAVTTMYAPMHGYHSFWLDAVCERMTEGGCGYFTENIETILWQAGKEVTGDQAALIDVVAKLDDGSQVWKAALTIYENCQIAKNCKTSESDIYLHVVFDEAQGKWLLNRVLHGPYIDFPKLAEQ